MSPLDTALSVVPHLRRAELEQFVARAIEHLDALDGDTDVEFNGDERDMSYITQDNGVVIFASVGNEDDEEERGTVLPQYGVDQTQLPRW